MIRSILHDSGGAAVVEATILFPIIFMVFAALVLLAMYLPQRAILQRATQYTAIAMSTARSDEWIGYDGNQFFERSKPDNVYVSLFKALVKGDEAEIAEKSVRRLEKKYTLLSKMEDYDYSLQYSKDGLTVTYDVFNLVIYKEIIITAERKIPMPVDLSFIGFPKTLDVVVTSVAVVQNGEEFVRNIDIVVDIVKFLDEKFQISSSGIFQGLSDVGKKIGGFLGI